MGDSAGGSEVELDSLGERLRVAVAAHIAARAEPEEQVMAWYVSPERAWEDAADADMSEFSGRLTEAAALVGLDHLAASVLAVCVAPELDSRFGRVLAFLHDDALRRWPTPRLIASLLAQPGLEPHDVLGRFAVDAPLRRRGCIRLVDDELGAPLVDQAVRVASPLISFLLGVSLEEPAVDGRIRRAEMPPYRLGRDHVVQRIRASLAQCDRRALVVAGPDAPEALAVALGQPLALVDARAATDTEVVARAELMAALERRAIVFDRAELLSDDERFALRAAIDTRVDRMLLCAATSSALPPLTDLPATNVEVPMPSYEERRSVWAQLAGEVAGDDIPAKFRLSACQIARAVETARQLASARDGGTPDQHELAEGARRASSCELGGRAKRVSSPFTWEDLVLPERQLDVLHAISSYLRYHDQVFAEWGYDRTSGGRAGVRVLFSGAPGTGKTMAAAVIANDLQLELFAIDLATVVSKYVGDTERNLERIFSAAEGSNAILLFDEADALFGRRSDVSDSRDRYANIEVAYLLQRMEAYPGVAILATNLKQNLDEAFMRRLDFVVDFPSPDGDHRRRMWRLAIPPTAPMADDVDIDFIAHQFKLSGGSIRNCSIAAAFEAAAAGKPIGMAHLVRAVSSEYEKLGRLPVLADFERSGPVGPSPDTAVVEHDDGNDATKHDVATETATAPSRRTRVRSRIEEL